MLCANGVWSVGCSASTEWCICSHGSWKCTSRACFDGCQRKRTKRIIWQNRKNIYSHKQITRINTRRTNRETQRRSILTTLYKWTHPCLYMGVARLFRSRGRFLGGPSYSGRKIHLQAPGSRSWDRMRPKILCVRLLRAYKNIYISLDTRSPHASCDIFSFGRFHPFLCQIWGPRFSTSHSHACARGFWNLLS